MDILFLDDMPSRHSVFKRLIAPHHNVTYVMTADEAKAAMQTTAFDLAFLDHDLAEHHYGATGQYILESENTGYGVARFIVEKLWSQFQPTTVIVHSMNPDGANRMASVLTDAGLKAHCLVFGSASFNRTVQGL